MPRYRRPRRQGVVYGPVTQRERGPDGGFFGRILGIVIVIGAVAVLGVGALNFIGDSRDGSRPESSPSPTLAGAVSPSPASSPTRLPPTPSPTPTALPSPTPEPTPEATPFALDVEEGPGYVTFGTQSNNNLRITDARTSFALNERITLSAQLTQPAASNDMTIMFFKYDPETGEEELVTEQQVRPRVPSASTFLRNLRPSNALDGPGIYVMRYMRGEEVMSEGWFEVTEPE